MSSEADAAAPAELSDAAASRRVWAVLYELARPHWARIAVIALFALLSTGAELLQPLIYRHAINDVAGLFVEQAAPSVSAVAPQPHRPGYIAPRTAQETLRTLMLSVAAMFVISVAGYFFHLRSDYIGSRVASDMESSLIVRTFSHVLRLPLPFFGKRPSAALVRRIDLSDEVSPVIHALSQQIAPEIIRLVGICAIMLTQSWELMLVSVALLPPYLWLARRSTVRLRTGLEPYHELWESLSARIAGALQSVKTVKLSGAERRESERLDRESKYAYGIYLGRIKLAHSFYIAQSALSNLSRALVLGYGGFLVLDHRLTPGDVVMFVSYLDRLYSPIDSLNGIAVSLQNQLVALRRAVRLLDAGPVEEPGAELQPGPGRVEFRDVRFHYVPEREVLRGLNLDLRPGSITGLVGPSGAGKTTTADLLLKLFEPHAGGIYLDGQPLASADPSAVRRAIGVVAADGAVFRGTLAENIRYKRPDANVDEVRKAAIDAGLGRLLERLPEGLDTEIGENGMGLSLGERQRLQIARVLVDRPRLLVLDEATANLDYATETEFRQALGRLSPRPTMLIIAHRYTMVKEADYVYVMRDGQVAEQGTPAHLIARDGWFAELARQSALPEPPAPTDEEEDEEEA